MYPIKPVHSELKLPFLCPPSLNVASQYHAEIHWVVSEMKHTDERIDATTYTLGCN
jgi:hypothetical protein